MGKVTHFKTHLETCILHNVHDVSHSQPCVGPKHYLLLQKEPKRERCACRSPADIYFKFHCHFYIARLKKKQNLAHLIKCDNGFRKRMLWKATLDFSYGSILWAGVRGGAIYLGAEFGTFGIFEFFQ